MQCLKINSVYVLSTLIILILLSDSKKISGQTCGFGCLGLGGFYGGYTIQKYDAKGLNEFIRDFNSLHSSTLKDKMDEFGNSATGFRLGANILRTRNSSFFFSFKGFYQYLREEHKAVNNVSGSSITTTYTFDLNYYGVGLDLGFVLGKRVDFKLIDAQVTFHSADFRPRTSSSDNKLNDIDFRNSQRIMGYEVGSGLIFHVIPDYVSLEATAGYTKFAIDKLQNDSSTNLENSFDSINNFVNNGGLSATVQLNIGIPLY